VPRTAVLTAASAPPRRAWKTSLPVVGAGVALLLLAFFPTWQAMAGVWLTSETFGHGLLVAPVSAWLVWRQRAVLSRTAPWPSWLGVACLALACAAWLAGELAGINVVAQFAVTAMLPSAVLALGGVRVARAIAFPLAFLLFMVPAGEVLHVPLMHATADATIFALEASGVPVLREGLHFSLPTGRWSVVEACSGLRYMIAAAMLASVFAHLNFTAAHKRVAFVVAALGVAVVANWARAYVVVMVGHLSHMRFGVGDEHVLYGWVFFGAVMFIVFRMGAKWRDPDPVSAAAPPGPAPSDRHGARAVSPRRQPRPAAARSARGAGSKPGAGSAAAPALAAMVAVVALTHLGLHRLHDIAPRTDVALRAADVLERIEVSPLALQPRYPGALTTVQGTVRGDARTEVFFAYFAAQHARTEMIGFGHGVVDETDPAWQILSRTDRAVSMDATVMPIREWQVRSADGKRLVWSWYTVAGEHTGGESRAKLLTVGSMIRGDGDHSSVSVVSTLLAAPGTDGAAQGDPLDAARGRLVQAAKPLRALGESVTRP
jgi:exosortase A